MSGPQSPQAPPHRFAGLDSIRFVCALWVVWMHCGFVNLDDWLPRAELWGRIARGLYHNLFNGQAAVIVFFLVSGFCIHAPQSGGQPLDRTAFLARRFLRLGLPLLAALLADLALRTNLLPVGWGNFALTPAGVRQVYVQGNTILWSLFAELAYYAAYPLLLGLRRKLGWMPLFTAAGIAVAGVVMLDPRARDFPAYGHVFTPVLGLPSWLLGCLLAERVLTSGPGQPVKRHILWLARLGLLSYAIVALVLRFHVPLPLTGLPMTLQLFAVLAFGWLQLELRHARHRPPPRWLEWCGSWSYSLYLTHLFGFTLWRQFQPDDGLLANRWAAAVGRIAVILVVACGFYLLVERPAWRFARWLGGRLRTTDQATAGPVPVSS